MKFKAIQHDEDVFDKTEGSSLLKATFAKYSELVDLFGEPAEGDGYKVDARWVIEFEDGVVCTIYNWKNGPNYGENRKVEDISFWHIGGKWGNEWHRVISLITANKWERIK